MEVDLQVTLNKNSIFTILRRQLNSIILLVPIPANMLYRIQQKPETHGSEPRPLYQTIPFICGFLQWWNYVDVLCCRNWAEIRLN